MNLFYRFTLFLAFVLALGIRLYDLTDPPFDFHPTRQWRSAVIARGMFYATRTDIPDWQRETAIAQWKREAVIEPPILEWLVATTYRIMGKEQLWVARVYSSTFWVSAGLAIFLVGREIGFAGGGVLATIYFLFLQYGMIASRTFQPDPLMVALMAWGLWAVVRWRPSPPTPLQRGEGGEHREGRGMDRAVLAGILTGFAIFVKSVAGFMLGGALVGLVIGLVLRFKFRVFRNPQLWLLGGLAALPTVLYYVYGLYINGFLRQQLSLRFFPEMWRDPAFYIRWQEVATGITGFTLFSAALIGIFLMRERALRGMALGLWIGYGVYSMTFPYHTITHDYYQLPLILIVAVTLIPTAGTLLEQIEQLDNRKLIHIVLAGVVTAAVFFKVWDTRVILARQDYRNAAGEWARYADIIPPGKKVLAITKTYGYPLAYYGWVNAEIWLGTSDVELRELAGQTEEDIARKHAAQLEGKDLFLVTNFNELDRQPELKEYLMGFEIFSEGSGYVVYDLKKPLDEQP